MVKWSGAKIFVLFLLFQIACGGGSSSGEGSSQEDASDEIARFKLTCEEVQFILLLNKYRTQQAVPTLRVSKAGVLAARWHASNMIELNYFDHTEPNGRSFTSRTSSFGYKAWSENIAAGGFSANGTFCQWKKSFGHNANMLDSRHRSTGIGRSVGGVYGVYWSSSFGGTIEDGLVDPLIEDLKCNLNLELPSC